MKKLALIVLMWASTSQAEVAPDWCKRLNVALWAYHLDDGSYNENGPLLGCERIRGSKWSLRYFRNSHDWDSFLVTRYLHAVTYNRIEFGAELGLVTGYRDKIPSLSNIVNPALEGQFGGQALECDEENASVGDVHGDGTIDRRGEREVRLLRCRGWTDIQLGVLTNGGRTMSAAALTREYVMQNKGETLRDIQAALPDLHPKTVRRVLELYTETGYLCREDDRYYPPVSFPSHYFVDQTLMMMRRSETKWSAISNMAIRVPVAPKILAEALRALADFGVVEVSEDNQYAKLTQKGAARCRGGRMTAKEITRLWKPPRSAMR